MKRRIKDPQRILHKTFHHGLMAGIKGKSQELCPHHTLNRKEAWLTGWREGRDQFLSEGSIKHKRKCISNLAGNGNGYTNSEIKI